MKLPPAKVWLAAAAVVLVLLALGYWWNRQPGALARRLARYRAAFAFGPPCWIAACRASLPTP